MAYFPFFVDIKDMPGLIVGGGRVAAEKIEKLLPFGPRLTVVAPLIREELWEKAGGDDRLLCKERAFQDGDVEDVGFVIAVTDDEKLNAHISTLCKEQGVPVNVADDKEKCSFLFPSLVKEGKLTVGISTSGASPQAAIMLRRVIESNIPAKTEEILDFLADLRSTAKERIRDSKDRAAFLKEAALFCMEQERILTAAEVEQRIELAKRC